MKHLLLVASICAVTCCVTLGQHPAPPETSTRVPTCETMYVGLPGGSLDNPLNWEPVLPDAGTITCFPDEAGMVGAGERGSEASGLLPGSGSAVSPAAPTAMGSCCLGSSCLVTNYFDCRELGGWFLEGVGPCTQSTCATGACCDDAFACFDDDGGGSDMDEETCGIIGGDYLGGARCDETDPCQRFRIPEGFEIIELTPGWDARMRRRPQVNNCGEIVVHIGTESSSW